MAPCFSVLARPLTLVTHGYIEKDVHEYYRYRFPRCLPVCVSRTQKAMLGDESIPVVYNGIDAEEIEFNDQPEDFSIIVGRMRQGKGLAEANRIARDLTRDNLPVGFDVVFLSNISRAHRPVENHFVLKQIHRSLNSDGRLILRDVFMRRDHTDRSRARCFRSDCFCTRREGAVIHPMKFVIGCTKSDSRQYLDRRFSPRPFEPDGFVITEKLHC